MRAVLDWLARHFWPYTAYMHSKALEQIVLMLARRITLLERELDTLRRERTYR